MTTKDVLALALEALENVIDYTENWPASFTAHDCWKRDKVFALDAITAIKQAITPETGNDATPEASAITAGNGHAQEPVEQRCQLCKYEYGHSIGCENNPVDIALKSNAAKHRPTGWVAPVDRYAAPVLFNPYTGEPRDVRDVQSDPQGILIVPIGHVEMVAAPTSKQSLQVAAPKQAEPVQPSSKKTLALAQEGIDLHDHNAPEYIICAELIRLNKALSGAPTPPEAP